MDSRLQALVESNPEEALKLLQELESKVVHPHGGQQQVLDALEESRFLVLNAGRRWGKTKLGAKVALRQTRQPNKMVWWVAPTYKVVKRGYREVVRQLPDGVLTHTPPPDTNFDAGRSVILRFKNGSRIEFYSAERPEGMLGEGVDFAVLDEAAIMPPNIWEQTISPTLLDREGGALLISTPRGRNWFYKAWLRGQDDAQPAWRSWTFPTDSNPHLPDDAIEQLRGDLPALTFQQEVLAAFLAAGSSVFMWDAQSEQRQGVHRSGLVEGQDVAGHHVVLGIDLAKTNDYTVIYGASTRTFRNVYFERMNGVSWREQKRRIRRAVGLLLRKGATGVTLVMDSTGVGDPIVEDIEAYGFDVIPINFTSHKNNMVKLFAKDLEDARAFILADYVTEFQNFAMNITPAGRITYAAPQGEHDDVVAAKILQHHGLVNEGVPDVTTINVDPSVDVHEPPVYEPSPADDPSEDDFRDLLDDEDLAELHEPERAVTLHDAFRPPTIGELMDHDPAWSSFTE